ncbi:MAG: tetratricopeptide repeat protein [Bacteroidales bacterium]|nr:tetratricopeptide repeat protein [Bacteroidales bacterium]
MKRFWLIVLAVLAVCAIQAQNCDSLYLESLRLYDQKKFQAALDEVNSVMSVCPVKTDYYLHRGKCYRALKNIDAELISLDAAIAIDSNCIAAWTTKALYEIDLKRYSSAIKSHEKVLSLISADDSTVSIYQTNLGALYVWTNQNQKAFDFLWSLCHVDSFDMGTMNNLAASAIYLEKYEEAAWALNKILEIFPDNVGALINMGLCKSGQKDYKAAMKYYDQALRIDPEEAYALNNAGWALFQLGKNKKAFDYINKSIRIDSTNAYAYRNKAYVQIKLGVSRLEVCKTLQLAIDNGFTEMYGGEVLHLQQELCK